MLTDNEYEEMLDKVDKMTLYKPNYTKAFEFINDNVNEFFEPERWENLRDLVKMNCLKHGLILSGVFE